MIRPFAFVMSAALFAGAAMAGTEVKLAPFSGIDVHGGGDVKLIYGPVQRVTVIKGDLKVARIRVTGSTLDLSPCDGTCWGSHDLAVEIVTPSIAALNIHGGGSIAAHGNFPKQPHGALNVHGGGDADLAAIPFEEVDAEVHGGGNLRVKALNALTADVHGGGDIVYLGHPAKISTQAHGGGSIHGE